jgi:hypothetical protein
MNAATKYGRGQQVANQLAYEHAARLPALAAIGLGRFVQRRRELPDGAAHGVEHVRPDVDRVLGAAVRAHGEQRVIADVERRATAPARRRVALCRWRAGLERGEQPHAAARAAVCVDSEHARQEDHHEQHERAPGAESKIARYTECKPNGDVELWTMEGTTHVPTNSCRSSRR